MDKYETMFKKRLLRNLGTEGSEFLRRLDERLPLFADTLESDDEVLILIDLPGCDKESIELTFSGGELKVEATKQKPLEEGFRYVSEGRTDFITGGVPVPDDVIAEEASAKYEDGLLKVRLPREKGENIEIE